MEEGDVDSEPELPPPPPDRTAPARAARAHPIPPVTDVVLNPCILQKLDIFMGHYRGGDVPLPPLGSVKFNVDGAVCGGFGKAGIGGILSDSSNRTLISFSKGYPRGLSFVS
ncbi:hypothetical protein V6N12_036201 [Hibiscus sabdariffa]|uniref:RNase H type-1 domain-containing protein n=1 Tax=Hibiscus sabdariffa TaxID=183260 RepID=A0ABR2EPY8_9ROSI